MRGKLIRILLALYACSVGAEAQTLSPLRNLKKVEVQSSGEVKMELDRTISSDQVRTEFFNDILQISLSDTSVYPAKIQSVSSPYITKVFAYQYAPRLVRVRLSMKGLAQEYQDRVQVQIENGGLRVKIQPPAKADSERTETSLVTKAGSSSEGNPESKGEARVESKPDASGSGKHELKADAKAEAKTPGKSDGTSDQLGLRKSVAVTASDTAKSGLGLRSTPVVPMRTVGILILFIGVFAGGAWWLRKRAGLAKWMTRISGKSTRVAAYKIEVISQHHLGPKKALSLVRVHDRMLVLGITDESITVLSEFDAEPMGEEKTASSEIKPALGVKNFAEQLARFESEQTSVSQAKPREEEIAPSFTAPKGRVAAQYRAQSQIRAKLEGMKSL